MSDIDLGPPIDDALLVSLVKAVPTKKAQAILNMGHSKLYEELGKGNLSAVKDGSRTLITAESILRYQADRPVAVFKPPPPPRLDNLGKLHAKQRQLREQRAKRRVERRRSGARA
jgi:hypothetical protein